MHPPRASYQPGDHVCTLYGTPEEHLTAAIEAIRDGLARGEKCMHVCGEHTQSQFRAALVRAGIDAPAEERRGALMLMTKHDAHLKGGSFDPVRMIDLLR